MSSKYIDIEIDRLVLQGIDPRLRARIAESVQRELAQLVARGGMPPQWTHGESGAHDIPSTSLRG